jgi:hypothetical protein
MIYDSVTEKRPKARSHGTSQDDVNDRDDEIHLAAFARCRRLLDQDGGAVPWGAIQIGFSFEGEALVLLARLAASTVRHGFVGACST